MRRLVVIVVNYRTPELTLAALDSLRGQLEAGLDEAVVVDNDSGDGSAERIQAWIDSEALGLPARLLCAGSNGGFAAGNNLAIRRVASGSYVLLNSDARLLPGALAALRAAGEAHPDAGLVGVHLEDPAGRPQTSCFRFHTPLSELIDAAATGPLTRLLQRWDVPLPPPVRLQEADWTSFACVWVRGEVFQRVGLLDDGYFLYYEDVDFCRRAHQAGWRVLCEPRARVVHAHGASTDVPAGQRSRSRAPRYLYRSRSRYFTKFHGRAGWWAANLLWLLGRAISLPREVLGRKPRHAVRRQWLDIWTLPPAPAGDAEPRA